ncbi:hypothetical protein SAMN05421755_104114 [Nitrosomonas sp. Nm33]|nr:hypothetical protein SAMN05421755_104114 [Nitrosomonas sp. Nm33]
MNFYLPSRFHGPYDYAAMAQTKECWIKLIRVMLVLSMYFGRLLREIRMPIIHRATSSRANHGSDKEDSAAVFSGYPIRAAQKVWDVMQADIFADTNSPK